MQIYQCPAELYCESRVFSAIGNAEYRLIQKLGGYQRVAFPLAKSRLPWQPVLRSAFHLLDVVSHYYTLSKLTHAECLPGEKCLRVRRMKLYNMPLGTTTWPRAISNAGNKQLVVHWLPATRSKIVYKKPNGLSNASHFRLADACNNHQSLGGVWQSLANRCSAAESLHSTANHNPEHARQFRSLELYCLPCSSLSPAHA